MEEGGGSSEERDRRGYDPLYLSRLVEEKATRPCLEGLMRRYYRFRPTRFYGGAFTADAVGCNLRCVFCWSFRYAANPEAGRFYSAREVAKILREGARRYGFRKVRVSGAEPTIGKEHLLELIEELEGSGLLFILETNAILLSDRRYAKELAKDDVHVRVSLKGTNSKQFSKLTGAEDRGFQLQLEGLRNLVESGASVHASAMISFSTEEEITQLLRELGEIRPNLVKDFEPELLILYDSVRERLRKARIIPKIAVMPNGTIVRGKI